jgi:hypothetical protein
MTISSILEFLSGKGSYPVKPRKTDFSDSHALDLHNLQKKGRHGQNSWMNQ